MRASRPSDAPLVLPHCDLAQKLSRFRQRLVDLAGVLPSALRAFRTSAAFSTDDWRDLLDQFVRLKFRSEFVRHISDQSD